MSNNEMFGKKQPMDRKKPKTKGKKEEEKSF